MSANARVLNGYLMRESALSWGAVTVVLLGIMLSTRFARFLAEAAAGELPRDLLFKVVALSSLQYLVVLIPVSLMLGLMLALGRLYKDHEITALSACGVGLREMYRPFIGIAGLLAVLTAALALQIGPWAGRSVDYLVKDARRLVQYTPFEPGQFKSVAGGREAFYTERMSPDGRELGRVFVHVAEPGHGDVLIAGGGVQRTNPETGERDIELRDGIRYEGDPGQADFTVTRFGSYRTRVTPPDFIYTTGKRKVLPSLELLASSDLEDQAELQWRIAAPITVLLLALIAVPLSHTSPRQGRYGKVVLGILVYLVYINGLGVGQALIAEGWVDPWLGMWWVHGIALAVALWLIGRRSGWGRA